MAEISIKEALNKAFVKVRPERAAIDKFKANLSKLIDGIKNNPDEREEFIKNLVSDFLKNTWYSPDYFINTHKSVDLVIHNGNSSSPVGVMIEAKKPGNKNEMVSRENLNAKALQELLLYYFRETEDEPKNLNLKNLIITNAVDWFIFDASIFYKLFSRNKTLVDLYADFKANTLLGKATDYFYSSIATPHIEKIKDEIEFTYFNIMEYKDIILNNDKDEDNKLINLYKILSPTHLLKKSFSNDSNTLNENFYFELLYIMGLIERKEEGKKIIDRNEKNKRQPASLIEETIYQLEDEQAYENILWDISLELNITWINRIIFLKLLESQQFQYQSKNMDYAFLNTKTIKNFNDLNILFFKVLAIESKNRDENNKVKFMNVPYLNSSLFEITQNEHEWLKISSLRNEDMDIFSSTVLKDETGNKRKGKIKLLDYLFEFLNAYDFSSEGKEQIQEEKKTLINASVLGLIFEKLNGYKDGSYFTPGFVTSYICSETIKNVVIDKFKEIKKWDIKTLIDISNKINNSDDIAQANKIINNITIVDPAVGSGHFLVSALNELIAIKSELGILVDNEGKKIRGEIKVLNDELIVYDEVGGYFEYKPNVKEKQRIQEALFQEKRNIIENCLFGVDINPNSVKICRLRLWIELLKNAYYTKESGYKELETLPNLDINIKSGNSLISRFNLNIDITNTSSFKKTIKEYKEAAQNYKNSNNKTENKKLLEMIKNIKANYRETGTKQNYIYNEIQNLEKKLGSLGGENIEMEFITEKQKEDKNKKIAKINKDIEIKKRELYDFLNGKAYEDAFEWRFEFPELLSDDGNFIGFDVIIGNPPYISTKDVSVEDKNIFIKNYGFSDDTYTHFFFRGFQLLNEKGILNYISPKTFWTTQTKRNLRDLLLKKRINYIFDTGSPFKEAMVDTCITSVQNCSKKDNEIVFLDGSKDLVNPNHYTVSQSIYQNTQNSVFFKPTPENIKIQELYGQIVRELYNKWWNKISTSKNIEENKIELEEYRNSLKPGDITLLGCLTEGGQGLATANNGKYIAVRKSSKWAKNIIESRPKKLDEAIKTHKIKIPEMSKFANCAEYLNSLDEKEIAKLFDILKEKHGRDIFGQGYLYKLIDDNEIAEVDKLTDDEKEKGIDSQKKYYVPYDKGDKDGNRWYLETPFAIAWSIENVQFLKTDPNARYQGYMYFFKEGFCWTNILNPQARLLKTKIKSKSVNDVGSMSLFSIHKDIPNYYLVALLNSELMFDYYREFINCTVNIQINDIRQLPIYIPSIKDLDYCDDLYQKVLKIKMDEYNENNTNRNSKDDINKIEAKLDEFVRKLYQII
jgi:adenine-specific DNA-methyltransferase